MRLAWSLVAAAALLLGSVAFSSGSPARATDSGPLIALYAVACPDAGSVPANSVAQPSVDDTGGAYQSWGATRSGPVSSAEAANCKPRSGVTFRLSSVDRGAALSSSSGSRVPSGAEDGETTTVVGTTGGRGLVIVAVADLTESQRTDLDRGNSLWVSGGAPAGFLGLRCHTDLVNSDDLEYLRVAPFEIPSQLTCVHYTQGTAPAPTTTTPLTAPSTAPPPAVSPPAVSPSTVSPPAVSPSTVPPPAVLLPSTTTTTRASTGSGTAGPTTTTAPPPTTAVDDSEQGSNSDDGGDSETALPVTGVRLTVGISAPGAGPLSANLTTVWTQDLVLSLACADETFEIRIGASRQPGEQGLDIPASLVDQTCSLTLVADGVESAGNAADLATVTVNGDRLTPGDSVSLELDADGPRVDAAYAAVGGESVLPPLSDDRGADPADRLPLVPVTIGLLIAALAGGILVGRTGARARNRG
ncbi:MAG: hypothetical protein GY698_15495 [Actinomycetia bacterium]|nr:hypothetical protein [Actinomycetes bacterium]